MEAYPLQAARLLFQPHLAEGIARNLSADKPALQAIYERLGPYIIFYRQKQRRSAGELERARAQVSRLEQIAWQPGPAQTVDQLLRLHDPRGYATRRNIDKLMEGTFWCIAVIWLVVVTPLAATKNPDTTAIAIISVSGGLTIAAQIALLFGGTAKERQWARGDSSIIACVKFSLVLELADTLSQDPTNIEARRDLANHVELAAEALSPARFVPPGLNSKAAKKRAGSSIKRASNVLGSYGETALWGGPQHLRAMADDFGRAALRIASGNWHQIAELRPEQPSNEHRDLPLFLREIVINVVKVAVPALIAAAVALVSTTGNASAG